MSFKSIKNMAGMTLFLAFSISCSHNANKNGNIIKFDSRVEIIDPGLQAVLDSAKVTGSVLIYDLPQNRVYSNDFERCNTGFLPASTFKIPNTIIALETGVVENEQTRFKWNGEKRRLPVWEQDLSLEDAFRVSCVPCYQEIAKKIGVSRMKNYLHELEYGNMVFDSLTIDLFWLEGESTITMNQQLDFLQRLYLGKLPVSKRTIGIMKKIMLIESNSSYKFSGKTGWAIRNGNNTGWFVGYLETGDKVYFVVTNIEPADTFNMDLFPLIRTKISMGALRTLDLVD